MGDAVILEEQLQRLALVVENKPGVLARVSCIFHRYNSNIHRLLVKPSRDPELSLVWMEVVLADAKTQIICKRLRNLVNVRKVTLAGDDPVSF